MTGTRGSGRRTAYCGAAALVALLTLLPVGSASADLGPFAPGRGGFVLIFPPGPDQAQQAAVPYLKQPSEQQPNADRNTQQDAQQNTNQNPQRITNRNAQPSPDQSADQNTAESQGTDAASTD